MSEYLAHIRKDGDLRVNQSVIDHCRKTAIYAAENLEPVGLYSTGMIVGLLHDIGKCKNSFLEYLIKSSEGDSSVSNSKVDHSSIGAIYVLERYHNNNRKPIERLTSEIIAYAIAAHHGAIDCIDSKGNNGFLNRLKKDKENLQYDQAIYNFFSEIEKTPEDIDRMFELSVQEIRNHISVIYKSTDDMPNKSAKYIKTIKNFQIGMLVRMVSSALIDADRADTYIFMSGKPDRVKLKNEGIWDSQLSFLENKLSMFDNSSDINKSRQFMSDQCFEFQHSSNGIFKLDIPTGAGKTLSSLRFSLNHAAKYKKQRIFFIIPLLGILDQNVKVIKDNIQDPEIVIEHHSNVILDNDDEENAENHEMLCATWDSPIVVSTMVQLMNTLFSHKNTCIRRMNSLADSIIVIDEVQSIPKKMLYMFNCAMNYLAYCCNATIVLSSATQPVFDMVDVPIKFALMPDMVTYNKTIWDSFKRTNIVDRVEAHGINIEQLKDNAEEIIANEKSLLIICNTKSSAAELFKRLRDSNDNTHIKMYHLSNAMCYANRKEKMDELLKDLNSINSIESDKKVICVATQVIEAGVDISFSAVIRVIAGLENIVQSAGRCNRNHEGDIKDVYIVKLKKQHGDGENVTMLPDIVWGQDACERFLMDYKKIPASFDNDRLSSKSIRRYYDILFSMKAVKAVFPYIIKEADGQRNSLYSMLSDNAIYAGMNKNNAQYSILNQAFKSAGQMFRVFEDQTTDIIVPYNDDAKRIINELYDITSKDYYSLDYIKMNELIEEAKKYTVQIFDNQKRLLSEKGLINEYMSEYFNVLISGYDNDLGITYESDEFDFMA